MKDTISEPSIISINPEAMVECFIGLYPEQRHEMAEGISGVLQDAEKSELNVMVDAFGSLYTRAFASRRMYSVTDVDCLARLTIIACNNTYVKPDETAEIVNTIKQNRNLARNKPANSEVPELERCKPKKAKSLPVVRFTGSEMMEIICRRAETVKPNEYI